MKRVVCLLAGLLLLGAAEVRAQGLAGTYALKQGGVTLTLVVKQDAGGQLSGSLASSTGARFVLQGAVQNQIGQGTLKSSSGGSFFQARRQGPQLLLALIEPDAQGRPDPKRVRQLVLAYQGSSRGRPQAPPPAVSRPPQSAPAPAPPTAPPSQTPARPAPQTGGQAGPAPGELGHAQWGFAFRPPQGWKHRMLPRGVVLGHERIAGAIIVLPHLAGSLQEVQAEMTKGLADNNTKMGLMGPLRPMGANALVGDYRGFWEGQPAKGQGIGTFSPFSGGAMIIAVTSPDKFGSQLTGAAARIAAQLRYFKVNDAALIKHFAGYWWRYSGTAQLSRESIIHLAPDGTYRDRHETAANVANRDAGGNVTSQYLGHSQKKKRGRWTVRGAKERGIIFVTRQNGSTMEIQYRVKPSRPQKYGTYYFNGSIHHWVTPKQLRDLGY